MSDVPVSPYTLRLAVSGQDLPDGEIAQQARVLSDLLEERLPDAKVQPIAGEHRPGTKGDPVTLGAMAVTFFTSGAAVALIECVRALLVRDNSLVVKVTRPDGSVVELNGKNVGDSHLREMLATAGKPG